ncbi:DUF6907 domain-containing protein [Lysinibacter cavernae]|uniref:DUF6907 domain-containing protein n=1 Tax=Lysinibacter cavernae TaxID=1640652 RepID=UPI0036101EC1
MGVVAGFDAGVERNFGPWWADICPDWCVGGHRKDDLLADRVHVSEGVVVPAVQLVGGRRRGVECVATLWRERPAQAAVWVHVGLNAGGEMIGGLDLSIESLGAVLGEFGSALSVGGVAE